MARIASRTILHVPGGLARSVSVALFAILAVTFAAACEVPPAQWHSALTPVGEVLRYPVGDGRTTFVDTNSQIHVNVTDRETQIVVNHGGALITGKGDRPLEVIIAGVSVQSSDGEFSVRERGQLAVDLLVSRGTIRVASTRNRFAEWLRGSRGGAATLFAGESASAGAEGVSSRQMLPAEVIAHRQAWKDGWLWFTDDTLAAAVARFNDYNTNTKLILTDPRLERIAVGGRFRPTEPDSFAATLKVIFGVKIFTRSAGPGKATAIYVSADCRRRPSVCSTPLGQ